MADKIRLNNPNDYPVGIITLDKPFGVNIPAHTFTMVTQDELDYLMGTCRLIQKGILRLAGDKQKEVAETLGINMENNANFMSDDDIKKKLSGNANQLKKWLDSSDINPDVLDKIARIAKGMNLAMSKIQILKDKVPNFEFFDD